MPIPHIVSVHCSNDPETPVMLNEHLMISATCGRDILELARGCRLSLQHARHSAGSLEPLGPSCLMGEFTLQPYLEVQARSYA